MRARRTQRSADFRRRADGRSGPDEPSLGLSPLLCKELFANLGVVRKAGIGILLVEQNARQKLAIADRGYLLENARIVHEDRAANEATNRRQKAELSTGSGLARLSAWRREKEVKSLLLKHVSC